MQWSLVACASSAARVYYQHGLLQRVLAAWRGVVAVGAADALKRELLHSTIADAAGGGVMRSGTHPQQQLQWLEEARRLLQATAAAVAPEDVCSSLQQQQQRQWPGQELHWGRPQSWYEPGGAATELPQQQPVARIHRLLPAELLPLQLPVPHTHGPQQQQQQAEYGSTVQGLGTVGVVGSSRPLAPSAQGLSLPGSNYSSPGALLVTPRESRADTAAVAAAANSVSCPGDHLVQQQDATPGLFTARLRGCNQDRNTSTASPRSAAAGSTAKAGAKAAAGSNAPSPAREGSSQQQQQAAGARGARGPRSGTGAGSVTASATPKRRLGQSAPGAAQRSSGRGSGAARLTPAIVQRTTLQ